MKLSDLYQKLTVPERDVLAKSARTTPGYLYQLATQWRGKRPSLEMIQTLAQVDPRLTIPELVEEFLQNDRKNQGQPATETVAHGV